MLADRVLSELRHMDEAAVAHFCESLRREILQVIPEVGGHFASPLGVVELTVSLHRAFDTPRDLLVWDVGHQAYVHKMVTGRRAELSGIRQHGGMSGFLKRSESLYDTFGAGHAGTSVSAALGMFLGTRSAAVPPYCVAIIGDGSLTTGMAFEALNHAGGIALKSPGALSGFIVVLNDNGMSISENVGALHLNCKSGLQLASYFNTLGFHYIGTIDGHNVGALARAIESAKNSDMPVLLHVKTRKGCGSESAEKNPVKWHGLQAKVSPQAVERKTAPSYTAVFAASLSKLAEYDPRIVAITAAMSSGTGLDEFAERFPSRFFDVGICEQHAITLAAGMSCAGLRPVVAIYSTFLQRGFDQVAHDVCIQNLPVTFAIDRGGFVGNDGETHQGMFDIAFLRTLPNMTIMSPRDDSELPQMLTTAVQHKGPCAIRFPRDSGFGRAPSNELVAIGCGKKLRAGTDALLLGFGPVVTTALGVAERAERELGMSVAVIDARFAKPLDVNLLRTELPRYPLICTLEEHALHGGFGAAVLEFVHDDGIALRGVVRRLGGKDAFLPHGSSQEQRRWSGLDEDSIFAVLQAERQHCSIRAVAA